MIQFGEGRTSTEEVGLAPVQGQALGLDSATENKIVTHFQNHLILLAGATSKTVHHKLIDEC